MDELTLPLTGSIALIYGEASVAQKAYNAAYADITQKQKNIRKQLLALAPEELRFALEGAIHHLFAFKSASLDLKVTDYGGEAATANLLSRLAQAWKEVVGVTIVTEPDEELKLTIQLYAVENQ
jgi:hypothetical protein